MTTPEEPTTTGRTADRPREAPGRAAWVSVVLLLVGAAALCLWRTGDRGLWSSHEARAARVAMTMLDTGDWVVPQLAPGEPTYQKPPLFYWLVVLASRAGGGEVTPLAARLPSALATVLTALVVYLLARDIKGHRAGLLAGIAFVTCARLMWVSRVAVLDPLLGLWVTLALYLFHRAYRRGAGWAGYLWCGAPLGLGLLTKGPIALVLPATVVVLFLLWEAVRRRLAGGAMATLAWPCCPSRGSHAHAPRRGSGTASSVSMAPGNGSGGAAATPPPSGEVPLQRRWGPFLSSPGQLSPAADTATVLNGPHPAPASPGPPSLGGRGVASPPWRTALRCVPPALLALAIAAPWFVAVHLRTHGDLTLELFVYHHLCRSGRIVLPDPAVAAEEGTATGTVPATASWTDYLDGRKRGLLVSQILAGRGLDNRPFEAKTRWTHYLARMWGNTFPWSVFLPGALVWLVAGPGRRKSESPLALPVVWLVGGTALLSAMAFRKSEYLLPMYPALAVLVGVFLAETGAARGRSRFWDWLLRVGFIGVCLAAAAIGGAVLAMLVPSVYGRAMAAMSNENDRFMFERVHGLMVDHPAATVSAVMALLAAFAAALLAWWRGRLVLPVALVGAGVAAMLLAYVSVCVPVIDEWRSHRVFVERVAARVPRDETVVVSMGEDHELFYLMRRAGVSFVRDPDGRIWPVAGRPRGPTAIVYTPVHSYLVMYREEFEAGPLARPARMVDREPEAHRKPLVLCVPVIRYR